MQHDQHERRLQERVIDGKHPRLAEQVGDLGRKAVGGDKRSVTVERRHDVDPVYAEHGVAYQRAEHERAERSEQRGEDDALRGS